MKRSIEIAIDRNDMQEFMEVAADMKMEANIIPGQEKDSLQVKFKIFYINPANLYFFGIKFNQALMVKDVVI